MEIVRWSLCNTSVHTDIDKNSLQVGYSLGDDLFIYGNVMKCSIKWTTGDQ